MSLLGVLETVIIADTINKVVDKTAPKERTSNCAFCGKSPEQVPLKYASGETTRPCALCGGRQECKQCSGIRHEGKHDPDFVSPKRPASWADIPIGGILE